jgi:hypothetical protein
MLLAMNTLGKPMGEFGGRLLDVVVPSEKGGATICEGMHVAERVVVEEQGASVGKQDGTTDCCW